jgi:hypothetical protein
VASTFRKLMYRDVPLSVEEAREANEHYMNWRFPDLKELENLKSRLTETRAHLQRVERQDAPERILTVLRRWVKEREEAVESLQATGNFPALFR